MTPKPLYLIGPSLIFEIIKDLPKILRLICLKLE